jgi:hypothetical protein
MDWNLTTIVIEMKYKSCMSRTGASKYIKECIAIQSSCRRGDDGREEGGVIIRL